MNRFLIEWKKKVFEHTWIHENYISSVKKTATKQSRTDEKSDKFRTDFRSSFLVCDFTWR